MKENGEFESNNLKIILSANKCEKTKRESEREVEIFRVDTRQQADQTSRCIAHTQIKPVSTVCKH